MQASFFWLSLLTINLAMFGKDIFIAILPNMANEMHWSLKMSGYFMTSYLFGMGCSQLLFGCLADRYGGKIMLKIGLLMFSIGCVLTFCVDQYLIRLLARVLTGVGSGVMPAIIRALIADLNKDQALTKMNAYLSMFTVISPTFAPSIGIYLFRCWGWQSCNLLLIFIAIFIYCLTNIISWPNITRPANRQMPTVYISLLIHRRFLYYTSLSCYAFCNGIILYLITPFLFASTYLYVYMAIGYFTGTVMLIKAASYFRDHFLLASALLLTLSSDMLFMTTYHYEILTLHLMILIMLVNGFGCGLVTPIASKHALIGFPRQTASAAALLGSLRLLTGSCLGFVPPMLCRLTKLS